MLALPRALVLLSFSLLAAPALPAQAGGSAPGEIWTDNVGLSAHGIAFGDHGGQLFAVTELSKASLYSSFDAGDATPALQSDVGIYSWFEPIAAAAAEDDTYLAISNDQVGPFTLQATLNCWSSSSPEPRWSHILGTYSFIDPCFDISRNGQVIVSTILDEVSPEMHLTRVHDPATGAVTRLLQFPLQTWASHFDLSPDGTVLAHSSQDGTGSTLVIPLATGQVSFTTPGSIPAKQALSQRGDVLVVREHVAQQAWHLRVFSREDGAYVEKLDVVTPATQAPADMAVSDDGSVVAAAWHDSDLAPGKALLRAYDVATGALLLEHEFVGGLLENAVGDLELSADGSRLALGIWGAISAADVPELTVWAPWQGELVAAFPVSAAVFDVAVSPDGARVAAHRTSAHPNQGYLSTSVRLYDTGGADLTLQGVPSIGGALTFHVYGEPGDGALLLAAPALAAAPIPIGAGGALLLDPAALVVVAPGTVGPFGIFSASLAVPPSATLVGATAYLQGATTGPLDLGTTLLHVTVLN
jgi:hypothetical protein